MTSWVSSMTVLKAAPDGSCKQSRPSQSHPIRSHAPRRPANTPCLRASALGVAHVMGRRLIIWDCNRAISHLSDGEGTAEVEP